MRALSRRWRVLLILVVAFGALAALLARPESERVPRSYYVAPLGADDNPGTAERPFRTLATALARLRPGDTLYVRAGTYREALRDVPVAAGTAAEPVRVLAYPGERPVLEGLLWLRDASFWTIDGLNVTWAADLAGPEDHMVKFSGGVGWTFTNAEVWGARSFAAILVSGGASGWTLSRLFVHDTYPTNQPNQDQLIYVSDARAGVIEFNLLVNSPNGRGVKLGRPRAGDREPDHVVVRYNTIVANAGGNVSVSYDARDNVIERNILVDAGDAANVGAFNLDAGTGTVVRDNVGWGAQALIEAGAALVDGGGNLRLDPALDASYRPTNSELLGPNGAPLYGHLARPPLMPATDDGATPAP